MDSWHLVSQFVIEAKMYHLLWLCRWILCLLKKRYLQHSTTTSRLLRGIFYYRFVFWLGLSSSILFLSLLTWYALISNLGSFLERGHIRLSVVELSHLNFLRYCAWPRPSRALLFKTPLIALLPTLLDKELSAGLEFQTTLRSRSFFSVSAFSVTSSIFPCFIIQMTHSGEEQGITVCFMLLLCWNLVWKKRKCSELLFTLLHVTDVKIMKASTCMTVKCAGVEGSGLVVVFHECIGSLNHNKDVLLNETVKAWVIIVSDNQRLHHSVIHRKAQK